MTRTMDLDGSWGRYPAGPPTRGPTLIGTPRPAPPKAPPSVDRAEAGAGAVETRH